MRRLEIPGCMLALILGAAGPLHAAQADVVEVPLRVEQGRLMVTAEAPDGSRHDFAIGLGMSLISESGAERIGSAMATLTLAGVPVDTEQAQTVPDRYFGTDGPAPAGVIGAETLNAFDILIDAPNGRLLLKPLGRSVRWDGIALSSPARMTVYHEALARVDVEVGGELFGGLLDLVSPEMAVNQAVMTAAGGGDRVDSFRMGYAGWPSLPIALSDSPVFNGWDPDGKGFVIIGAAIAWDCAIAVSFVHEEFRTCMR